MKNPIATIRRKRHQKEMVQLTNRYLADACTPEEGAEFKRRLDTDADFRSFVDPILWMSFTAHRMEEAKALHLDRDASWARLRARAIAEDPTRASMLPERLSPPETEPPLIREGLPPVSAWVRFGEWWEEHRIRFTRREKFLFGLMLFLQVVLYWHMRTNRPATIPPGEQATPRGAISTINLPNGSRAILAPGSTMTTPESMPSASPRSVVLDGEGYFDITAGSGPPFTVRLTKTKTIVHTIDPSVATTFDVHSYLDDETPRIVVANGQVAVVRGKDSTIVSVGQELALESGRLGRPTVTRDSLTWRNGVHSYYGRPLEEVLRDMWHWYGLTFTYENSTRKLGEVSVIATFPVNTPIDDILARLKAATGWHFIRGKGTMKVFVQ